MKKVLSLVLVLAAGVVISGCSSETTATTKSTQVTTKTTPSSK